MEAPLKTLAKSKAVQVLRTLQGGEARFTEIKRSVKADISIISRRLKELEELGLVKRSVHRKYPRKVAYTLTPKGQRALNALAAFERALK